MGNNDKHFGGPRERCKNFSGSREHELKTYLGTRGFINGEQGIKSKNIKGSWEYVPPLGGARLSCSDFFQHNSNFNLSIFIGSYRKQIELRYKIWIFSFFLFQNKFVYQFCRSCHNYHASPLILHHFLPPQTGFTGLIQV